MSIYIAFEGIGQILFRFSNNGKIIIHICIYELLFLVQVSCVSGAQLSNYATFLVHPEQAALSIVLTALSTAAGVVVTPLLVLLLLGQRIPVDVQAMAASIMQIVILPVGVGESHSLLSSIYTLICTYHVMRRVIAGHELEGHVLHWVHRYCRPSAK